MTRPYARRSRYMNEDEYHALLVKVIASGCLIVKRPPFTNFTMVTGDFEPTQVLADVRFIAYDNSLDDALFQVDDAGDAVLLLPI
jgi:hypothetical protein